VGVQKTTRLFKILRRKLDLIPTANKTQLARWEFRKNKDRQMDRQKDRLSTVSNRES